MSYARPSAQPIRAGARDPGRWPPMKSDPLCDDIPEASWVRVTPTQVAGLIAARDVMRAKANTARGRA